MKIDLYCPQNIVSQLHLAKTDPGSSRAVSLRQLISCSYMVLTCSDCQSPWIPVFRGFGNRYRLKPGPLAST